MTTTVTTSTREELPAARRLSDRERNACVRTAVQAAFPDTKFRVANGYSFNTSIKWTDGPSERDVRLVGEGALLNTFSSYGTPHGVLTTRSPSLLVMVAAYVAAWRGGRVTLEGQGRVRANYITQLSEVNLSAASEADMRLLRAVVAYSKVDEVAYAKERQRAGGFGSARLFEFHNDIGLTVLEYGEALTAATR